MRPMVKKSALHFVEPMLLLRKDRLPEGADWLYEIKLDGYRALAIKSDGRLQLRSRNDNDFNSRYREIASALGALPDGTMIDGEVVRPQGALDTQGARISATRWVDELGLERL